MTEDEAKTKWCPFVRVAITPNDAEWEGDLVTNRGKITAANKATRCIASECMAWRESVYNDTYGHCGLVSKWIEAYKNEKAQ